MRQNYLDALAIVREIGGPDLFVTFTANPMWKEVQDELRKDDEGNVTERVVDRPDLLNNAFKCKFDAMMDLLCKQQLFGKVAGHIWVVEFQKRGKPHVHLLLSMAPEDKFRTKERVDKFFCAEIPDPIKNPLLFKKVTKMMVHGPCSDSLCKKDGVCSKNFPKKLRDETTFDANRNCHMRRRNLNPLQAENGRWVYQAFIVPYCAFLTLMFDAHINCEVVADSQRAIKYLFKYIFKGYDVANLKVMKDGVLNYDEVANFINARFVSAFEAHWRLMEYALYGRSHTVIRLALHLSETLPNQVAFEDGYEIIPEREEDYMVSMLTAFFKLCKGPADDDHSPEADEARELAKIAKKCRYVDVVKHFIYEAQKRAWKPRKKNQDKVVCRIRDVSAYNQEMFAFRMLLLHVVGPTCFEDVRTWAGITYDTFVKCAQARNLIEDDDCYYRAFDDYIALRTPYRLRDLFAGMLLTGTIINGEKWWAKYRDDLAADFKNRFPNATDDEIYERVLQHLERVFLERNKHCEYYGLPAPKVRVKNYQQNIDQTNCQSINPGDFKFNAEQLVRNIKYLLKISKLLKYLFFCRYFRNG